MSSDRRESNLLAEALERFGEGFAALPPGRGVAASAQAHDTHWRVSARLGIPFRGLAVDARGRIELAPEGET